MEVPVAITVGIVFGSGLYLVMQRNLLRFIFGLILMSGSVNVALFVAGRLTRGIAPLVPEGSTAPPPGSANALPQALILTAIVIGFGLIVFALVLLLRTYERLGTVKTDELAARLVDPHPIDPTFDTRDVTPLAEAERRTLEATVAKEPDEEGSA